MSTVKQLKEEAKILGIKNYSKMNKKELMEKINLNKAINWCKNEKIKDDYITEMFIKHTSDGIYEYIIYEQMNRGESVCEKGIVGARNYKNMASAESEKEMLEMFHVTNKEKLNKLKKDFKEIKKNSDELYKTEDSDTAWKINKKLLKNTLDLVNYITNLNGYRNISKF